MRGCRIAAIARDCKSLGFGLRRFESYCWHKNGEVAQLGERESHNLKVTGSTPVLATKIGQVDLGGR